MNRTITMYGLPNCDTCRKAMKSLQARGYEPRLVSVREAPPSAEELAAMIEASGLPIGRWFNVNGDVYKSTGLKDKLPHMTREEQIRLMASDGMLIKRPVVYDGSRATVGYKEDAYAAAWPGPESRA